METTIPKTEHSPPYQFTTNRSPVLRRVGAVLALAGAFFGSACSEKPAAPARTDNDSVHQLDESYQSLRGNSGSQSVLVLTERISGRTHDSINALYDSSKGFGYVAAHLALLSQLSGRPIEEINLMYRECSPSGAGAVNCVALALAYGKPIAEIQALMNQAKGSGDSAATLVLASLCSERPIAEMNELFKQVDCGSWEGKSLLVLGAVRSGRSIETMQALYDAAPSYGYAPARLAYLAAIYNRPIEELRRMQENAAVRDIEGTILVEAALVTERPISEINALYEQFSNWSSLGSAQLTLTYALIEAHRDGTDFCYLPQIAEIQQGRFSTSCSMPILSRSDHRPKPSGWILKLNSARPL